MVQVFSAHEPGALPNPNLNLNPNRNRMRESKITIRIRITRRFKGARRDKNSWGSLHEPPWERQHPCRRVVGRVLAGKDAGAPRFKASTHVRNSEVFLAMTGMQLELPHSPPRCRRILI